VVGNSGDADSRQRPHELAQKGGGGQPADAAPGNEVGRSEYRNLAARIART
jgi:hypothetical protein